ncbi:flavodoxin domain-containing protein [Anaerosolibacter sp.]|uniref:flavodoxin domain-containing protein n=1 Tax=Anaerosolibacter sp. TaxID=1872527 RepID=UPI0039F0ED3F
MNTLIIYGSKHGTTGKCAAMLSEKIKGNVDLHDIKTTAAPDLTKYDRIVIGGSIYAGRIQKEITGFCTQNLPILKGKKIGLFICCMFPNNAEMQMNSSFPQELLNSAIAKENFGGEMLFSDMNFAEKAITKMVSKVVAKNDPTAPIKDMKQDISMILVENIHRFAQSMNNI